MGRWLVQRLRYEWRFLIFFAFRRIHSVMCLQPFTMWVIMGSENMCWRSFVIGFLNFGAIDSYCALLKMVSNCALL